MRRIVNVSCRGCNRLTHDMVVERPDAVVFEYGNHGDGETNAALLERRRRRTGGRSPVNPSVTRIALHLDDPDDERPKDRAVPCHCHRCGRLTVGLDVVLAAVEEYRRTGRRQTITAAPVAAR